MKYSNFLLLCTIRLCLGQFRVRPIFVEESSPIPRVVGGTRATLGQVPYQIGFKQILRRGYAGFCGGTLIKPKKILSAAHCFGKSSWSKCLESIHVGRSKLRHKYAVAGALENVGTVRTGQWRPIYKVMYPSAYRFPFHSDISIVLVRHAFIFNAHVSPIGYARTFQDYKGPCLVSGYGRTSNKPAYGYHNIATSPYLLTAQVEVGSNAYCSRLYRRNMRALVCIKMGPTDVAQGDSGGPLVCTGTKSQNEGPFGILVGVVSGNSPRVGSFFTRVSSFKKYIERNRTGCTLPNYLLVLIYCTIYFMFEIF